MVESVEVIKNLGVPVGILVYVLWMVKHFTEKYLDKLISRLDTMVEAYSKMRDSFDSMEKELSGLRRDVAELRRVVVKHEERAV